MNLFEAIFESAPDALVVVNDEGKVVMVNNQVKTLFGYEKDEIVGKDVETLIPDGSIENHRLKRNGYLKSPAPRELGVKEKLAAKRKDGSHFYAEISLSPRQIDGTPYVAAVIRDVTKKKRTASRLTSHEEKITEQNNRLMNFAHVVSHNLRSYGSNLNTMLSFLEKADTDKEKNEIIRHLKSLTMALNDTVQHLTEVVSIQTNISQQRKKANLREYVTKTAEVLSGEISKRNALMLNHVDTHVYLKYNLAYLESILLNLLSNTLKYSSPKRQPVVTVESLIENNRLVLKVSDNGIGIDLPRYGNKLFHMYATFHGNADARGVGLFITKNQVEAMGGKIEVESTLDVGTTFKVFLS